MRLTLKLTFALAIVLTLQFLVYGYIVSNRLTAYFVSDIKDDALHLGRAISLAVTGAWRTQGKNVALDLVSQVNDHNSEFTLRFVSLGEDASAILRPELPLTELQSLTQQKFLAKRVVADDGSVFVYSYHLVPIESEPELSALEFKQSFAPEAAFINRSMIRIGIFLLLVVGTTGILMLLLGALMVARPIGRLQAIARQVGKGDFSGRVDIRGRDEIDLHPPNSTSLM